MQFFADQCLDMARSILGHETTAINEDGTITPVEGEKMRLDEPGHAALAIGEFYRATGETQLAGKDLVDLSARCITAQVFTEEEAENGLAYSALGLLSFGPSKDRNQLWERLVEPTRQRLDYRLLARTDYDNHLQAFNIAKSVARYSMGLSKKDETGRLIDRFVQRLKEGSTSGFCDDRPKGLGGAFDIYGVLTFVFIRQALQLHANMNTCQRKLPSLRTYAEKYIKLIPDIVREDGLGWCYGRGIGAYGQMHCISIILQALRDDWIAEDKKPLYWNTVIRLFQYFFATYLDQENGYLVIRDAERSTGDNHTTRMANLDAARYLCQWFRLAGSIGEVASAPIPNPTKSSGRFVIFDRSSRKEQGLFVYQDPGSGLHILLPLVSGTDPQTCDSLAFPHSPGIFDWPANQYLPVMIPELTFGDHVIVPSFYGKRCVTGLGLRKRFYFSYEQPQLITKDEKIVPNLGSCKVKWTFSGNQISCEFIFVVERQVQLDSMRYVLPTSLPHSRHRSNSTYTLGEKGMRVAVVKDDFQATWMDPETVFNDLAHRTYYGNIHYYQVFTRKHSLIMQPRHQYCLAITLEPDITFVERIS